MPDRAIQLVAQTTRYVEGNVDAIRVTITAAQAIGMPGEVFAYLLAPLQPGQTEAVASFDHICSPVDLAEYPIDAPDPAAAVPWFRTSGVDLVFRSRGEALEAYNEIVAEVGALRSSLDAVDQLESLGTVWLGTPPSM